MHVPKRQPADPAKSVDCNSNSHFCSLQDWSFVYRAAAKGRTAIDLSRDRKRISAAGWSRRGYIKPTDYTGRIIAEQRLGCRA
jgi:hypothetical protein